MPNWLRVLIWLNCKITLNNNWLNRTSSIGKRRMRVSSSPWKKSCKFKKTWCTPRPLLKTLNNFLKKLMYNLRMIRPQRHQKSTHQLMLLNLLLALTFQDQCHFMDLHKLVILTLEPTVLLENHPRKRKLCLTCRKWPTNLMSSWTPPFSNLDLTKLFQTLLLTKLSLRVELKLKSTKPCSSLSNEDEAVLSYYLGYYPRTESPKSINSDQSPILDL